MPPKKKASKNAKKPQPSQPGRRRRGGGAAGLDANAVAHARLLHDPCSAPLAHPVYAGGEGGYLVRNDAWFSVGTGAGISSGVFHWTPGYMCPTGEEILTKEGSTPGVCSKYLFGPGKLFLPNVASNIRCVAACVRVAYIGAESARSGRIHLANTSGAYITPAASIAPDDIANGLNHYMRTPPTEVELRWKPNDSDQLFVDPNATYNEADRARRAALTVVFSGVPAAQGIQFHLTAVYEWQPKNAQGIATGSRSRNTSSNTLDQVLNFLERSGEKFVSGAIGAGSMALNAYMGNTFGLMGSATQTLRGMRLLGS